MSLEAIEKILEMERNGEERRTAAGQKAKEIVSAADAAGRGLLEGTRTRLDKEGKELLRQAEERAESRAAVIRREAEETAGQLQTAAATRLDAAAELIVERVVR